MKPNNLFNITSLLLIFGAPLLAGTDAMLDKIAAQEKLLAEKGITVFYNTARAEGWSAPLVRSQWAIARTMDQAERKRLVASFELGQRILVSLPALAATKSGEEAELFKTIVKTSDFADWIATPSGYGNALIARRSLDLALPLVGELLVDRDTSDEVLSNLESRLNPVWASVAFATAVLDGEMDGGVFASAKSNDDLRALWREGVRRALESKDPNWAKTLPSEFLTNLKPLSVRIDVSELSFFTDDTMPSVPTTEALMSSKHHELVVTGVEPANVSKLRELLRFRVALKTFPDETVRSDFYPGLKGAFDEAWRSYYKANKTPHGTSLKIGLVAWTAYEMIIQKQLITEDDALTKQR